jgi:hypothetical protein
MTTEWLFSLCLHWGPEKPDYNQLTNYQATSGCCNSCLYFMQIITAKVFFMLNHHTQIQKEEGDLAPNQLLSLHGAHLLGRLSVYCPVWDLVALQRGVTASRALWNWEASSGEVTG